MHSCHMCGGENEDHPTHYEDCMLAKLETSVARLKQTASALQTEVLRLRQVEFQADVLLEALQARYSINSPTVIALIADYKKARQG